MKRELWLIIMGVIFAAGMFLLTPDSTSIGSRAFYSVLGTTAIFYLIMRLLMGKFVKPKNFKERIFGVKPENSTEAK